MMKARWAIGGLLVLVGQLFLFAGSAAAQSDACRVGQELGPGDYCTVDIPGINFGGNRFEPQADGSALLGTTRFRRGGQLSIGGFRASPIRTLEWRIDAVPGGGGTNRPPRPTGSIPAQTLAAGGAAASVNVARYFMDPDGDALTYSASSNRTGIVRASASGSTVTLTPVAAGTATVTVTARDPGGLSATQSIAVTVQDGGGTNRPPQPSGSIPGQTLAAGGRAASVGVARYFTDPDGDALTYTARSSRTGIVTAAVSGSTVTLTPVAAGTATVTVTARDPDGLSATQSMAVTVQAAGGVNGFTDDPLVAGVTPVRAVHFRELRTRIDGLRTQAGLSAYAWTDPTLRAGVTPVRSVHLTELRTALRQAYAAAGQPPPAYTDAVVRAGMTPIRAAHITELRTLVIDLEDVAPTGLAPANQDAFDALVAGQQLEDGSGDRLVFVSAGRLREIAGGESHTGNYRYVRTGPNAGTLTYTYDVTGNDPGEERSELRLTFTTATAGRFLHTYTERGSAPVVRRGSFEIVDASGGRRAPDLVVGPPSVTDSTPTPGQSFTLSITVRNEGAARAAATTLRYYRSTDSTISASDTAVGTDAVAALAGGASSPESIALTAPSSAGTYYYGACVEPVSGESDTRNNCSTGVRVTVESGGGGRALTGEVTTCSGTRTVGTIVNVVIAGTVTARRAVSLLTLTGRANGDFVGIQFIGSMSAGQTESFRITGVISTSALTLRCEINAEFRTSSGSQTGEAISMAEVGSVR